MAAQRTDEKDGLTHCLDRNWRWIFPALCLFLVCGCSSISRKTVSLSELNRLKDDGVTKADVTQLLGPLPKLAGNVTVTVKTIGEKKAPEIFTYPVKIRDQATDYRGRMPLKKSQKKIQQISFEFDKNQKVSYVHTVFGGKLDEAPARAFKKGVTTRDQVYDAYGYPDGIWREPDGSATVMYFWVDLDSLGSVKNSANKTFEGRCYLETSVLKDQNIHITFDAKGIAQELKVNFKETTTYQFAPRIPVSRSDIPFDEDSLVKAKLNRLSVQEICQLFGDPESISLSTSGERTYRFSRRWGKDLPDRIIVHAVESKIGEQTLLVTFGPDQLATSIQCTGGESTTTVDPHFAQNLFWATLVVATGTSGQGQGHIESRDSESRSGTKIDSKLLDSIQPGKATAQDIVKLFGIPNSVTWNEDGSTLYGYQSVQSSSHNPAYGFNKSIWECEIVNVEFDSAGFLKGITQSAYKR
jgi:outer membrane protein assembly factor BamE (lipoprotein component of BamABCDE complex)